VGLLCGGLRPRTGTGEHARTLITHLPEAAPDLEFVVFARPPFSETLPRAGISRVTLPRRGPLLRVLAEHLRAPGPELALLHALALASPLRLSAPLVATLHDLCMWQAASHLGRTRRQYLRWAVRRSVHHATTVLVDSETIAEEVRILFPHAADRLRVVPLGVDAPTTVEARGNHVLLVGADDPRKQTDLLVAAYTTCAAHRPMPDLVLVGRSGGDSDTACGQGRLVRRGDVNNAALHALVAAD